VVIHRAARGRIRTGVRGLRRCAICAGGQFVHRSAAPVSHCHRNRPWRRSHHDAVDVLRNGERRAPRRSHAGLRRHRSAFAQPRSRGSERGHHAAYVKKLNEAVAKLPELQSLTLSELLASPARVPAAARAAIKDNGGGHLNHDLFWSVLAPPRSQAPQGALARAIDADFGSSGEFRRRFGEAAAKHFASGWVALARDRASRKLEIIDLKDHDVVTPAKTALLILDVWEHAYYLKYQNRRPDFIEAFWSVVNWGQVGERFDRAAAAR